MNGINTELKNKINLEDMVKNAFTLARETAKVRRAITRNRIEQILEAKQLRCLLEDLT